MSKIKILVVPPDRYGVGKFRMLDPFKYIGENHSEDVHVDLVFNLENRDELFDGYDIVIFHSFIHQTTQCNRIKVFWQDYSERPVKIQWIRYLLDKTFKPTRCRY